MKKSSKSKSDRRQAFRNFIKETFRARERSDYKEFFTRGMRGHDGKAKLEHGWMYVRVFVLSFTLFSLIAFLIAFAENGIAVPTLYLLGGAFMNLTVAVFIYELNPERNLPFVLFILIMAVGTAVADFIALIGYYFYYPENAWLATLWTAFLEEAAKAIPAIIAILICKKRSPMLGFIIGAAIGAGFSITEDMGYIYAYSWGVYDMVEITVERAWTAVCTHTLWTAVIGWAFCKFKCRPYDLRFWAVVIASIALHFLWDIPVEYYIHILPTAFCVIAVLVFSAVIVKKERKPYRQTAAKNEVQLVIPIPEDKMKAKIKYAKRCSHAANLIAAVTAILAGVLFIAWCFAPVGTVYEEERFETEEEFIEFVQGDKEFIADWDKKFDFDTPASEITDCFKAGGVYIYAVISVEEEDGYYYDYVFQFYRDEETDELTSFVASISVNVSDTEWYWLDRLAIPEETSEGTTYRYVNYAEVNARNCYYDGGTGEYVAVVHSYYDHTEEIVISAFACGILLIGAVAFVAFKIKSKKIRRKQNVG